MPKPTKYSRADMLAALESLIKKGLVVSKQDEDGQTRYYPTSTASHPHRRRLQSDRP
jgi:DNA-binding MarR family transcriptional regulator